MTEYLLSPAFKSHLENAYYIAGLVVGLSAFVAALQYLLTRKLAREAAKREAYSLAAEKCEQFGADILPAAVRLHKEIESKGLLFLKHASVSEDSDRIMISLKDVTPEDYSALNSLENSPMQLLNRLEAFALFFESGVAAELPGFLTVGCAYCDVVKVVFPLIAALSDDDPSFEHIKSLYIRWQKHRDSLRLIKQRTQIDIELKKSRTKFRRPIGA